VGSGNLDGFPQSYLVYACRLGRYSDLSEVVNLVDLRIGWVKFIGKFLETTRSLAYLLLGMSHRYHLFTIETDGISDGAPWRG
jgi:hypothetical protein